MSDAAPDVLHAPVVPNEPVRSESSATALSPETVEGLLRQHWGLSGQIFPVDEDDDAGFLIDNGHLRYLLEIRDPSDDARLRAEHEVMRHIIRSPDGPPVPEPVPTKAGPEIVAIAVDGKDRILRLLTVLDGEKAPAGAVPPQTAKISLGTLLGSLALSLADFDADIWTGAQEDELTRSGPKMVSLLSQVTDQQARDMIARTMVAALRRIHPLTPALRTGLTLPDLSFADLVGKKGEEGWCPTGIDNLAGLSRTWHVAALARACSKILTSNGGEPESILPTIAGYQAIAPLNQQEIEAVWPMIMSDMALIAATAENRRAVEPQDTDAAGAASHGRSVLATASTVTAAYMHAAILDVCNLAPARLTLGPLLPDIDPERIRTADLGVRSPLFSDGNWMDANCDWKFLARVAWETGIGSTRYGEYRLSRSHTDAGTREPENFALHMDVCLPVGTSVCAPFSATVIETQPQFRLRGEEATLILEGMNSDIIIGMDIGIGAELGSVGGLEGSVGGLRIRLSRDHDHIPPLFSTPGQAAIWRHLAPSPSPLLRADCDAPTTPGSASARGWREFVFDETGCRQIDLSGAAPLVGHGHPAIAAASYRQHLLIAATAGEQAEAGALVTALEEIAPKCAPRAILFSDRQSALTALSRIVAAARIDDEPEQPVDERDRPSIRSKTGLRILEPFPDHDILEDDVTTTHRDGDLVVFDEWYTGYGRLVGTLWATDQMHVEPDFVLAGSCDTSAMAVIFCNEERAGILTPYAVPVSPVDASTALAALRVAIDQDLRSQTATVGQTFADGLKQLSADFPLMTSFTGAGLLWDLQLEDEIHVCSAGFGQAVRYVAPSARQMRLIAPLCLSQESANFCMDRLRSAFGDYRAQI